MALFRSTDVSLRVRPGKPKPDLGEGAAMDDVDLCRRRVLEYEATRGQPGFDQQKLHDMVSGCAYRHELLRTDLKPAEEKILRELIGKERPGLWS